MFRILIWLMMGTLLLNGCKPSEPPPNPYDNVDPGDPPPPPPPPPDPASFVGLHQNIFKPTCANSGCHDGTFEPDFRTIESSYNTLVLHPIVKNNPAGSYQYRVLPGDPARSVLWNRLTEDIDGRSGIMPLATDPGSDWNAKKAEYLGHVRAWIEGGARDMFGNPPQTGNLQPALRGMTAFADGSGTPLPRSAGNGPIQVPIGANSLELWFSVVDDQTPVLQLQHNQARFSTQMDGFEGVSDQALQFAGPVRQPGYFGSPADYHHKITVNPRNWPAGTQVFVRIYVKDPAQPALTELPADGSVDYIKTYCAFVVN